MAVAAIAVLALGQTAMAAPEATPPRTVTAGSAATEPAGATIVIDLRGAQDGYTTKQVTIGRGGALSVVNNDTIAHSVTSVAVGTDGDPLFDVVVPAGQVRTIPTASTLGGGEYAFYCSFHPSMRGTLTIEGESDGEVPVEPDFEQPLVIPKVLTGSDITIPMRKKDVRVMAHGPKTSMWTYARQLPRPDDQASDRSDDPGDLRARPAAPGGLDDRAPARRPPELGRRRPAHDAPHQEGRPTHLHLPAARGGEADAGGLQLLPRPPHGPDRAQQLAWAAGDVPGDRPRGEAAWVSRTGASTSRCTSPSAASPRTTSSPTRSRRVVACTPG